jgi:hypothetical protein
MLGLLLLPISVVLMLARIREYRELSRRAQSITARHVLAARRKQLMFNAILLISFVAWATLNSWASVKLVQMPSWLNTSLLAIVVAGFLGSVSASVNVGRAKMGRF